MKILPDRLRCHMTRVSGGSRYVLAQAEDDLHFLVEMIPDASIPNKFHPFVQVAILLSSVFTFFMVPRVGVLIGAYWIYAGWRNGYCHHCTSFEKDVMNE